MSVEDEEELLGEAPAAAVAIAAVRHPLLPLYEPVGGPDKKGLYNWPIPCVGHTSAIR